MAQDPEELRKQNFKKPISRKELERRWKAVRQAMEKAKIDCLVTQNNNQHMGGYVPYFTDIIAENGYPVTVVFPLDGEMALIKHGGPPAPPGPPAWAAPGVKDIINRPYFVTFNFTTTWDAEAVVETAKKHNAKSLGFVSPASMSAVCYEYIKDNLPGVKMQDATDLVDEIKAVKSDEELEFIRGTIEMQDKVFGATLALIHPGMRGYELRAEIQRLLTYLGSEEQLIMLSSGPKTTMVGHKGIRSQDRVFEEGDAVFIMIEVNGPGGFYAEIGRTICMGDVPKPLQTAWNHSVEAQDITAELLKPGAKPEELFAKHNKLLASWGYPMEGRLYAHGQGYDLVERPGICAGEKMTIKKNMNITVHPFCVKPNAYAFCCDNFFTTESGGVRIHKTPREVFVI